ncbi:helix-turn-helix domain-containing protein [Maribacter sp. X9]|uniref:helix-turn-helix domain-containing protein n=1 Tax=Maribacter sp. X9 TaxID=3402159 RepID=UPI003AF3ED11
MSNTPNIEPEFIKLAEGIVLKNLSNEQFGVSELAEVMDMSRSSLLRKIKKNTFLSASQFIRQVRLQKGMELLRQNSLTVSEISYQVGFGSTSYFIKCFREHYGLSPGEVGKGSLEVEMEQEEVRPHLLKRNLWWTVGTVLLILLAVVFLFLNKSNVTSEVKPEKSIAVLPFKNESNDSTNLYFVNGLMESALGNLQKIEDLRVISRTSVEKYRNTEKGITEIAEELNVNYLVEGSGQRVGDQVLLNVQLIEATSDKRIWGAQYSHKVSDVFALQNEVAQKIAAAIEVVVTPAELEQIEKKPTDNLIAYDYYLKALSFFYKRTIEGYKEAIPLFEEAIGEDPKFALAYANISISYYYLDMLQNQKQYKEQINNYADKALLYDPKSDISLIAKALYYIYDEEYRLALPHLEKALEYNPNSSAVVKVLALLYANNIPDTAKHLKYALLGVQLDIAADDSIAKSYTYLNLSHALIQTGFVEEALTAINKSLDYAPDNYYAPYLKAMILFAKNGDIERATKLLEQNLQKDTTRLDILQEVANFYYYQEDYDNAFLYFKKFVDAKEKLEIDSYPQEDIKIGFVYEKMGLKAKAVDFFKDYADYCEKDESIYKSASMALKYAREGKYDQAIKQLNIFASQDNYQYWILLFMRMDPIMKPLKRYQDFEEVMQKIEDRFWENQTKLRKSLEEKRLI